MTTDMYQNTTTTEESGTDTKLKYNTTADANQYELFEIVSSGVHLHNNMTDTTIEETKDAANDNANENLVSYNTNELTEEAKENTNGEHNSTTVVAADKTTDITNDS